MSTGGMSGQIDLNVDCKAEPFSSHAGPYTNTRTYGDNQARLFTPAIEYVKQGGMLRMLQEVFCKTFMRSVLNAQHDVMLFGGQH